jgi:hypothetical protein
MSTTFHSATPTKVERKHHRTSTSISAEITAIDQVEQPARHNESNIDRDSAIALGVILIVILAGIASFLHRRLKSKRQLDLERQTVMERRDSVDVLRSYGTKSREEKPNFRMDGLWSNRVREDVICASPESISIQEKTPWTGVISVRGSTSTSSGSISTPANTPEDSPGEHSPSQDDTISPLPSPWELPTPPSQSRRKSHHRRQSSIHSIPSPLLAQELQTQSRRTSASSTASSPSQRDKRWWTDVARHGSTTHADARISVLESIPEPHAIGTSENKRRKSEAVSKREGARKGSGYDWGRPSIGNGRGPVFSHEDFSGDEQIDIDEESGSDGSLESPELQQDEFRGVIWDGEGRGIGLGLIVEEDVGPDAVDRMDWAGKA